MGAMWHNTPQGQAVSKYKQDKKHTCRLSLLKMFLGHIGHNKSSSSLTLFCAKLFRANINIYLHFIIVPHWQDTGSWNPFSCKTRTYLFYIVNIMTADDLATQGIQASATMIFTVFNDINSAPTHKELKRSFWGQEHPKKVSKLRSSFWNSDYVPRMIYIYYQSQFMKCRPWTMIFIHLSI